MNLVYLHCLASYAKVGDTIRILELAEKEHFFGGDYPTMYTGQWEVRSMGTAETYKGKPAILVEQEHGFRSTYYISTESIIEIL